MIFPVGIHSSEKVFLSLVKKFGFMSSHRTMDSAKPDLMTKSSLL
jgi:hypothetical protein